MIKIIYSAILAFACFSLVAQQQGVANIQIGQGANHIVTQQFFNDAFAGKYDEKNSYAEIEGSAFLADEPINATIIMNDGYEVIDIPLQVDLYKKDFIASINEKEEIYLNKAYIKEIILPYEGKDISYKKINRETPDQFYEVLYKDDKVVFYKERYVTVKEPLSNGIVNKGPRFTKRSNYYLKNGRKDAVKVKLKKKSILGYFTKGKAKKMNEYAKSNNIKLKTESDFVAVFEGTLK